MVEASSTPPATRAAAVAAAILAFDGLVALGEAVEDEWTYVTDLAAAGRAIIGAATGDGAAPMDATRADAVVTAAAEIGRITDPHRAIDWMSTFPAIVALALAPAATAGA